MIERPVGRNGALYVDIEVGMPLTGPANLAESPWLMLLGDTLNYEMYRRSDGRKQ